MRPRPVRVIPVLLLHQGGLWKTVEFQAPKYVGDPINAVRVFNEKEVDELIVLDIDATLAARPPDFALLEALASEAFMPLSYGGGLSSLHDLDRAFEAGLEKVVMNTAAVADPRLLEAAAHRFGRQSVSACIDVKRNRRGWEVFANGGRRKVGVDPVAMAKRLSDAGAGELVVQSMDRDGAGTGYDIELVRRVTEEVSVPVIALGGAGHVDHFREALSAGAAGVAAGSHFVFHGKRRAVLISYLDDAERASLG